MGPSRPLMGERDLSQVNLKEEGRDGLRDASQVHQREERGCTVTWEKRKRGKGMKKKRNKKR